MAYEKLFTVAEIAQMLKLHHLTIRRYIKQGKLKSLKVGGNLRIKEYDLEQFLGKSRRFNQIEMLKKFLGSAK